MKQVNHEELKKLIRKGYGSKLPLFVWGAPGIGKSWTIKEVAKELAEENNRELSETEIENGKFGFIDIRLSQLDPSDLRGLPHITNERTHWTLPSFFPSNPDAKCIIFLDELNLAPPSLQAAAYQLILDRKIGEYKLPDGAYIIAAGNRAEDRAGVFELPAPLANRMLHVELRLPSVEEWTTWASRNEINTNIIGFLNFKPDLMFKFDEKLKEKTFPTPRSWHFLSRMIQEERNQKDVELFASVSVGEGTAILFDAFVKLSRKIDFDEMLKNPKIAREIKEIGLKYSMIAGLAEYYRKDKKYTGNLLNVSNEIEPEFASLLLRMMKNMRTSFVKDVLKLPEWKNVSKNIGKYIN